MENRYWERIYGFVSENDIDARWILRSPEDNKAHGSLRIVSHPDLPPGHLRAFVSFVTSRKSKTKEEIQNAIEDYQMEQTELEIYSVNDHIETTDRELEAPKRDLEELFGVKVFGK